MVVGNRKLQIQSLLNLSVHVYSSGPKLLNFPLANFRENSTCLQIFDLYSPYTFNHRYRRLTTQLEDLFQDGDGDVDGDGDEQDVRVGGLNKEGERDGGG